MKAKDFRQAAWGKLHGKWGTMAVATLIYGIILGAINSLSFFGVVFSLISSIATLLLSGALALGFVIMAMLVMRQNDVRVGQLFDGFKNYGSALALSILIAIFTFLWSLLLVIPGIIKMYSYSMSYYVLADNPDMGANEARKRSMELMKGYKWRLFCLHFSFIGWLLLGVLTLGILYLWILPYIETAQAEFYQNILVETGVIAPPAAPEAPIAPEAPAAPQDDAQ